MTRAELPALRAQISVETERLGRIAGEIDALLAQVGSREPTRVEVVAAAAYLHNLYNSVESCLLRVAHGVDESVPEGPESHRVLLDQMSAPIEGLRPALLASPLAARLDEYRRFRHAFRHMYFFDLDWPRVRPLLSGARALSGDVVAALDALMAGLTAP